MIKVTFDTRAVRRMLSDLQAKQIPFATATALNDVAFKVQRAERVAIPQVFNKPRPFTQRSVLVTKATKANLTSTVFIRSEVASYLDPYEFGGLHVVPGKLLLDPIALRLDQYGQLTRTQVGKLNAAANDPNSGTFLGTVHNIYGYWQRVGSGMITKRGNLRQLGLRLLAKLEQPGSVKEHLNFTSRGEDLGVKELPDAFTAAMGRALATAR
jgi:hypothetical protein